MTCFVFDMHGKVGDAMVCNRQVWCLFGTAGCRGLCTCMMLEVLDQDSIMYCELIVCASRGGHAAGATHKMHRRRKQTQGRVCCHSVLLQAGQTCVKYPVDDGASDGP